MQLLSRVFVNTSRQLLATNVSFHRLFERQSGSSKYGAFAALSLGLPLAVSLAARLPTPSGPFPLIAANFVNFVLDVPPTARFSVFGWRLTDKVRVPENSLCCARPQVPMYIQTCRGSHESRNHIQPQVSESAVRCA